MSGPEIAKAVSDFIGAVAWPTTAVFALIWLRPIISGMVKSRDFSVKVGNMELSVQQDSEQTRRMVSDLQDQFVDLKSTVLPADQKETKPAEGAEDSTSETEDETSGAVDASHESNPESLESEVVEQGPQLILWVDDYPTNNAYEIERLDEKDVGVIQATSTAEALKIIDNRGASIDAIISDMGRNEDGRNNPRAGLDLLNRLRDENPDFNVPILFYTSSRQVRDRRAQVESLGASITSSPLQLFQLLGVAGS